MQNCYIYAHFKKDDDEIFYIGKIFKIILRLVVSEVRVIGYLAGDENLINAYRSGLDVHYLSASKMYNKPISDITKTERSVAKACLHGDTKIKLLNGDYVKISELPDTFQYTYCTNELGDIVPGKILNVVKTKYVSSLLKITLDDGSYFECTGDHEIRLRNGEYVAAEKLKIGESLMPIYTKKDNRGYEEIFHNNKMKYEKTHKMVSNNLIIDVWDLEDVNVVHHKDFNKLNNDPSNLALFGRNLHNKFHRHNSQKAWEKIKSDPNWREKISEQRKKYFSKLSPDQRKKHGRLGSFNKSVSTALILENSQNWIETRSYIGSYNAILQYIRDLIELGILEKYNDYVYCNSVVKFENLEKVFNKSIFCIICDSFRFKYSGKQYVKKDFKNFLIESGSRVQKFLRNKLQTDLEFKNRVKSVKKNNMLNVNNNPEIRKLQQRGKILKNLKSYFEKYGVFNYSEYLKFEGRKISLKNIESNFGDLDTALELSKTYNHKIISIEIVSYDEPIPVYDLEIEDHHNFFIWTSDNSGVNVHNCTFGLLYGKTPESFFRDGTFKTLQEAHDAFDSFFKAYPKIKQFIDDKHKEVLDLKGTRTALGDIIKIDFDDTSEYETAEAQRQSVNFPIQHYSSCSAAIVIDELDEWCKQNDVQISPFLFNV